nr:ribonuclease H-like domain-containing protein [Tanacetum cinerariifolium]
MADAKEMWEAIKSSTTASSSNTQNVAFMFAKNTSSTNDEVIHSFFANKSSAPQLDYDDLEQINDDDMEDMDIKWKDLVGFENTKVECFNGHKIGHFARDCRTKRNQDNRRRDVGYNGNKTRDNDKRPAYQDDSKALVTIDGEDINWFVHVEEDAQNYAMITYSSSNSGSDNEDDPHRALKDKGIVDSGCSRHLTGNKAHLADYQEFKGGSIAFGGSNGRITSKGKIKTGRLDIEDVYYVEELKHYNLFFVSQMCDKKNKGNLVRGLPSKIFENDHTRVACQKRKQHKASCKAKTKRKQHKASCKAKTVSSVNQPLQILHMDLLDLHL